MSVLSILATIVGTFMALAGVPQVIKKYRRKSAQDISAITYFIIVFGAVVWILYGLELKNFAIVFSNALGMATSMVILIEYYFYGKKVK